MTLLIQTGTRVRLARLPRYFDGPRFAHLIGHTGTAAEVTRYGAVLVRWDEGSEGAWGRECLDVIEEAAER